mmetsp:Transcript_13791/g.35095  ORF Transcript_13791/g.35095 Transcript_13791/m.35095 type:complete len:230 (+) Transcript_13791:689-1378(+)
MTSRALSACSWSTIAWSCDSLRREICRNLSCSLAALSCLPSSRFAWSASSKRRACSRRRSPSSCFSSLAPCNSCWTVRSLPSSWPIASSRCTIPSSWRRKSAYDLSITSLRSRCSARTVSCSSRMRVSDWRLPDDCCSACSCASRTLRCDSCTCSACRRLSSRAPVSCVSSTRHLSLSSSAIDCISFIPCVCSDCNCSSSIARVRSSSDSSRALLFSSFFVCVQSSWMR